MRGSRKFSQRGFNSDKDFFLCFLVDEGKEDPNSTKAGHHMAFRWRADNSPTLNAGLVALGFFQGIRTCIGKKRCSIIIFQGRSGHTIPLLERCMGRPFVNIYIYYLIFAAALPTLYYRFEPKFYANFRQSEVFLNCNIHHTS